MFTAKYVISNAGINSDNEEMLPDISFIDFDGSELEITSTSSDIGVNSMSELRSKINNTHTYEISIGYNIDGLVSDIIITY